jgi:hypothetical protein
VQIYGRYQHSGKNQMKLLKDLIETSAYICHGREQQDRANSASLEALALYKLKGRDDLPLAWLPQMYYVY